MQKWFPPQGPTHRSQRARLRSAGRRCSHNCTAPNCPRELADWALEEQGRNLELELGQKWFDVQNTSWGRLRPGVCHGVQEGSRDGVDVTMLILKHRRYYVCFRLPQGKGKSGGVRGPGDIRPGWNRKGGKGRKNEQWMTFQWIFWAW